MKKFINIVLAAIISILCINAYIPVQAEGTAAALYFSAVDPTGYTTIKSYLANNIYYMFLTDNFDLTKLTLTCNGDTITTCTDAAGTAVGTVDTETKTTLSGTFKTNETYTITGALGKYDVVIKQSTIPSLSINLPKNTLDDVHADKDAKFTAKTTLTTSDPSENIYNAKGKIKGRGNSSWEWYDKKGYQLSFDNDTSVLGMAAAKKWVLLPNASDASMMTNKLAFDLSKNLDLPYSTEGEYADVWVNGEYRGTYLIADKIEVGENRVNIGEDDVIAEMDNAFYAEEPVMFRDLFGNHFVLKDFASGDASDADGVERFRLFQLKMNDLDENLPNTDWLEVTSRLDVDSMAKVYLVNEYFSNNEYATTSSYWFSKGIIYAGPVWDFDTCTYAEGQPNGYWNYMGPVLKQLMLRSDFRDYIKSDYAQYSSAFGSITTEVAQLSSYLKESADMNYTRWDTLGKYDKKLNGNFEPTYQGNVDLQMNWLTQRRAQFTVPNDITSLYMDISTDRQSATITYKDKSGRGAQYAAFWNEENGQDDLEWAPLSQVGNNTWQTTIDLSTHSYAGLFNVHIYDGNDCLEVMQYAIDPQLVPGKEGDMYRMYNPNSGEHFYTGNVEERSILVHCGWIYEGVGWNSPTSGDPVYRMYNAVGGEHHYTMSASERDDLVAAGWSYEGIGWYSDPSQTTPLYREYNPNAYACNHNYTASKEENDWLISLGWEYEGIAWYGK
jgi:hypothetical protein